MTVSTTNELSVDTSRGDQLQIHVNSMSYLTVFALHAPWKVVHAEH